MVGANHLLEPRLSSALSVTLITPPYVVTTFASLTLCWIFFFCSALKFLSCAILLFTESADQVKQLQQWANTTYPDLIKIHVISKQPIANVENNIVDADGVIYKKYQVSSNEALFVIRPDGYIGCSAEECDQSYIDSYLNQLLK